MTQPISNKPGPKDSTADIARRAAHHEEPLARSDAERSAKGPTGAETAKKAPPLNNREQDAYTKDKPTTKPMSEAASAKAVFHQLNQGADANDAQVKASIQDAFKQWATANHTKPDAAAYPQFSASFIGKLQQAGVSGATAQAALDDAAPSSTKGKNKKDEPEAADKAGANNDTLASKDAAAQAAAALLRQS